MLNFSFTITTKGFNDIIDITSRVQGYVKESRVKERVVLVFVLGSTVGVTTIEYEKGIIEDFKETFEKIIPQNQEYQHNKTLGDGNAFSHLRAALLSPSLTVPIEDNQLVLGAWQQVVLVDFDNRPRERKIIVKIIK